jgi:succinate dehydrogenase/fumarate reductase flavoprotein subunit
MWEKVGIVRSGQHLQSALKEIGSLQQRAQNMGASGGQAFNLTWQQALDMKNLLEASELIARTALMREESRGAHFREDFPAANDGNWLKNIYGAREGEQPKLWTQPVKLQPLAP